jgi:hypothetical protein
MIEDSKKSFYQGCATHYMRLFAMVKLFWMRASNRWSDCSFKDLLTLLKEILPQGKTDNLSVGFGGGQKSMRVRMIAFYIMGLSTKTSRNALFMDSINSIVEKTTVMMKTATKIEKGRSIKVFWYFPIILRLKHSFANKESELLRWHKEKHKQDARTIRHPADAT